MALASLTVVALVALVVASGHTTTKTHVAALGAASPTTPTTGASTTIASDTTATTAITESSSDAPRTTAVPRGTTPATETPVTTAPEVPTRARGRVIDESGNPIAGIQVTLTIPQNTVYEPQEVTDADGRYDVPCTSVFTPAATLWLLLEGQPEWGSFGDPALNFAYTFVGGTYDPTTAPPVQCMTASEPAVVTTMHPGGIVTGHLYESDGTPFTVPPGSSGEVDLSSTAPECWPGGRCTRLFEKGMIVDGQYRFVGVPPGDYQVSHIGRSAGIHVEPGVTVTGDITRSP